MLAGVREMRGVEYRNKEGKRIVDPKVWATYKGEKRETAGKL